MLRVVGFTQQYAPFTAHPTRTKPRRTSVSCYISATNRSTHSGGHPEETVQEQFGEVQRVVGEVTKALRESGVSCEYLRVTWSKLVPRNSCSGMSFSFELQLNNFIRICFVGNAIHLYLRSVIKAVLV